MGAPVVLDGQGPRGGSGGGSGGFHPPTTTTTNKAASGAVPSLITSTGGLGGGNQLLLVPIFSIKLNGYVFLGIDPTDFNCEEDCIYQFRQEVGNVGRNITVHNAIIVYRNLGPATITVSVEAYLRENDSFPSVSQDYKIGSLKNLGKIFTLKTNVGVITGERPQLTISRKKNNGPFAFIKAIMPSTLTEDSFI